MRVTRDLTATLIVASIGVLYMYVVGGSTLGFISDSRGVAGAGLVFGLVACAIAGESVTVSKAGTWRSIAGVLVFIVVAAGIATVITNNATVLTVFMTVLVLLWAGSTLHHLAAPGHRAVTRTRATHA